MRHPFLIPGAIFFACCLVYMLFCGERLFGNALTAPYGSHYVHLAQSFLNGQLYNIGNQRFGIDDEAFYRNHWYVSFPPFPALLLLPFVALFGWKTPAALIWTIFAAAGPALGWIVLEKLNGKLERSRSEALWLVLLFAFGTVYFCTAVQGTVWYAAHVVATLLLLLYVYYALDGQRPFLAGLALGCAFLTRPTVVFAAAFFICEAIAHVRRVTHEDWPALSKHPELWRRLAPFFLSLALCGFAAALLNYARFDNPFEFGHRYLYVRWADRIERYGLFHPHFFWRNLKVMWTMLPDIKATSPHFSINMHGLALWFISPALLYGLWPKEINLRTSGLLLSVASIATINLMYQNTGWEQFGYRFSLDYTVFLLLLIPYARLGRGGWWKALVVWSVVVNAFGAWSFNRHDQFYDRNPDKFLNANP